MTVENEEIYRRLGSVEKEVYAISRQLQEIASEKPVHRIGLLEESMKQVKMDVGSIEAATTQMSKDLGEGLADLRQQAVSAKAQLRGFLGAGMLLLGIINLWPVIKELLKAAIQ